MNPASMQLAIACGLIALGSLFALHERRNAAALKTSTSPSRAEHAARIRRRVRIAALLMFTGILFGCSYWTDPHRNPVQFIAIWGLTMLLAIALLWYGCADFVAMRRLRLGRNRAENTEKAAVRSDGDGRDG